MIRFEAVMRMVEGVESAELRSWIEEGWVRPESQGGDHYFREIDVARVRLIQQLRRDLAIDAETLPLILNLLDQLYEMRRRLRAVNAAIAAQPPTVRRTLQIALRASARKEPPRSPNRRTRRRSG